MNNEEIRWVLELAYKQSGESIKSIASHAGVTEQTIRNLFITPLNAKAETLAKTCEKLGLILKIGPLK